MNLTVTRFILVPYYYHFLQVAGYKKRNHRRLRQVHCITTLGGLTSYAKQNNLLKMIGDEPSLGEHHRGVIFVKGGLLLGKHNSWEPILHHDLHQATENVERFVLPQQFRNLLDLLRSLDGGDDNNTSRAGLLASVKEAKASLTSTSQVALKELFEEWLEEVHWKDMATRKNLLKDLKVLRQRVSPFLTARPTQLLYQSHDHQLCFVAFERH